jgi:hypothetical protein
LARSSPASQQSGDGGLPGKKIPLDLQLADLAVKVAVVPVVWTASGENKLRLVAG